jgi:hypothetical protein
MALTRPKYSNIVDSDYKQSCRVVTTTDITLSGGAPDTYDGVSLAIGNRVLVAAQGTASQNGIYVVQILGTGSNGTWVRSFDANDGTRLTSGTQVSIGEGTDAGKLYRLTTPDPITIGSTGLTWVYIGGNPGGASGTVQYNDVGSLSGSSAFTFNTSNNTVMINSIEVGNLEVLTSFQLGTSLSTSGNVLASNINTSGTANVGTLTVSGAATINGNLIASNLLVTGTTTQINSTVLQVDDLNITVANGATDSASANGAGLTVNGALATLLYISATDSWDFNKQVIGQFTTTNLRATGGSITGVTGAASTFVSTNFSSGNARITGGSITGITGSATTLVATNFSSANAEITSSTSHIGTDSAGAVSRVANVYGVLGNFTDFSTANALITGGSATGITGAATTLVATNFSSGNAQITGGSATGITGAATTLVATNFSSGNAQITGGSITGITGAASTLVATNFSSGNISITGGNIILGAGTTSVAPLRFSTGGSLTSTAAAGMLEYTTLFHGTTQGTERGLIAAAQYYVLNANRGLATATATQTLFNQTFKVTSSTRYYYEAFISISKNNANANTLQYALVVGGGAVLAAHQYSVMSKWAAARTTVTAMNEMSNSITTNFNTLVSVSAASAAAAATIDARIQGFIDVTTGGTIDPQIALATNATTAPTLLALSYWKMYPVGPTAANTSIQ